MKYLFLILLFQQVLLSKTNAFLPRHASEIPINKYNEKKLKHSFDKILDKIETIYSPILERLGKELIIKRDWNNNIANAYAERNQDQYILYINGGIARSPLLTPDAFAIIVCHELGHHLGKTPHYKSSWSASEGQADYFATSKCIRKIFRNDDNKNIVKNIYVSPEVKEKCRYQFLGLDNEQFICERSSMAALSAVSLNSWITDHRQAPMFKTPSPITVMKTLTEHPDPQCRLDTLFQGALCDVDDSIDFDEQDPDIGACTRRAGDKYGLRPLCWYQPKKLNEWGFEIKG